MAAVDIGWFTIAANSSLTAFWHGWTDSEAVYYCVVPFPGDGPGVLYPTGHATLTQGEALKHVDGTWGRWFTVQNNAPFNTCDAHVIAIVDSL